MPGRNAMMVMRWCYSRRVRCVEIICFLTRDMLFLLFYSATGKRTKKKRRYIYITSTCIVHRYKCHKIIVHICNEILSKKLNTMKKYAACIWVFLINWHQFAGLISACSRSIISRCEWSRACVEIKRHYL